MPAKHTDHEAAERSARKADVIANTHSRGIMKKICLISMPEDAEYVLMNTKNVHGVYGASSVERLPTEIAITARMEKFKAIRFR
jgi:predicted TIM-barrel enzyme